MKVGCPLETAEGEKRVAMTPDSVGQIRKLGYEWLVQSGAGAAAGFDDAAYEAAGASVVKTAAALWKQADIVVKAVSYTHLTLPTKA